MISNHIGWTIVGDPDEGVGHPPDRRVFDIQRAYVSSTATCGECEKPLRDHTRYELGEPTGK
jgi:hypothetical protein